MFFGKKNNLKMRKCEECGSRSEEKFSFCPFCGNSFFDSKKERADYGLLGRDDFVENDDSPFENMGMMDKLVNSMVNSMMKNLDRQFKEQFKDIEKDLSRAEVKTFPNGIRIKISGPFPGAMPQPMVKPKPKKVVRAEKHEVNETQLKKMGNLPRAKAKTSVRRFGNKIVYELSTPGVISVEDVFVSRLESGYEIKAIGDKKIYVNSVPINLPLKKFSIMNNKLLVEFLAEHPQQGFE